MIRVWWVYRIGGGLLEDLVANLVQGTTLLVCTYRRDAQLVEALCASKRMVLRSQGQCVPQTQRRLLLILVLVLIVTRNSGQPVRHGRAALSFTIGDG